MDHNRFDYEVDLLFPIKDFLKKNTSFEFFQTSDIKVPDYLYDMPKNMKFNNINISEVNIGCFGKNNS